MKFAFFIILFSISIFVNAQFDADLSKMPKRPDPRDIIRRGWMKFFVTNPYVSQFETSFEINEDYMGQLPKDFTGSDEYGPLFIPSPYHFYFVLTGLSIHVISGRRVIQTN